jgi:hypothetical protein
MDDTYERNRTQERGNLYEKDKVIFEDTASKRQADADKLMEVINGQTRVSSERVKTSKETCK